MRLNSKEKLEIIKEICEVTVEKVSTGEYRCNPRAEIKDGGILKGITGSGFTSPEAINDAWKLLTELKEGQYIVVGGTSLGRDAFRWKGRHWARVKEGWAA